MMIDATPAASRFVPWRLLVVTAVLFVGAVVALIALWFSDRPPLTPGAPVPIAHAADPAVPGDGGTAPSENHTGPVTSADGFLHLGDPASVFDDSVPAVARLDPALLSAVRAAARDASAQGITFEVNSGWRSPALQQQMLDGAVADYGSRAEAARWVSTPEKSLHVSGQAIDLGSLDTTAWLRENGDAYGLCQVYENESWHFELRREAPRTGCPALYRDPTEDPRLR